MQISQDQACLKLKQTVLRLLQTVILCYFVFLWAVSLFQKLTLARGNVEDWLGKVEEAMVVNLRKMSKFAISDFQQKKREDWCVIHPSQVSFPPDYC